MVISYFCCGDEDTTKMMAPFPRMKRKTCCENCISSRLTLADSITKCAVCISSLTSLAFSCPDEIFSYMDYILIAG